MLFPSQANILESVAKKAAHKVESIPDQPSWLEHPGKVIREKELDDELTSWWTPTASRSPTPP